MAENKNSRSGVQTAVDLARLAKALARIAKAAAAAGLKGAAVAAVKESLPFLIKLAVHSDPKFFLWLRLFRHSTCYQHVSAGHVYRGRVHES